MFKYVTPLTLAFIGYVFTGFNPTGALVGLVIWLAMELIIEPNKPKKTKK